MAELVTVALVGALLAETIVLVKETITITAIEMFRTPLRNILDGLNSLKRIMNKYNEHMNLPNEELRSIYDLLRACQYLVKKCNKISRWHLCDKYQCLRELADLDNLIVRYCAVDVVAVTGTHHMEKSKAGIFELTDYNNVKMSRMRSQVETENVKGLYVTFNNKNLKDYDELLDESDPVKVESTAGGYGMSAFLTKLGHYYEQVKASPYEYDVFLSFRGDDTRESFTSTLFYYLSEVRKVKTFMDVNFKKGSQLEELLKIIEKSRISIVVFSENYAESEWCLKELVKIFEERNRKGHEVVPVFYKVNPSELRHQDTGKTKEHMDKHHNKYGKDSDIVNSWSSAIKELGNSSGYTYWSRRGYVLLNTSQTYNREQSFIILEIDLAKDIAEDIWTRLQGGEQGCPSKLSHIIFILLFFFYWLS